MRKRSNNENKITESSGNVFADIGFDAADAQALALRADLMIAGLVPNEVVGEVLAGASPMKAWREHLRLSQAAVAERLNIKQPSYAGMETVGRPRKATIARVAKALGITTEQLDI